MAEDGAHDKELRDPRGDKDELGGESGHFYFGENRTSVLWADKEDPLVRPSADGTDTGPETCDVVLLPEPGFAWSLGSDLGGLAFFQRLCGRARRREGAPGEMAERGWERAGDPGLC